MDIARKEQVYSIKLNETEDIEIKINGNVVYTQTISANNEAQVDFRINEHKKETVEL